MTEVGLIPNDWKVKPLNEVSKITRLAGYEYSSVWKEDKNGEIIALRGFNIGKNKIIEKEFIRISNKLSLQLNRSRLFKGNVIYPCVGTIGNAAVIEENDKYHIQQNIAKITPDEKQIYSYYLSYYLMSFFGLNEIFKFNGTSSQPNILVGSLRQYSIVVAPIKEQKAIATTLRDFDNYITHLEKLIAKKRFIKQGAMQQLLKPKEGWVVKKLGDYLEYEQPTKYIVTDTEYNDNNQIPVLTAGKSFILGYTNEEFGVFNNHPVIIFDDFTTATKFVDFDFKVKSSAMKILKPRNKEVNLRFVYEIMQRIKYPMGIGDHKRHWIGEYQYLEIEVPSPEEQTHIANILSDMENEISTLEKQLTKAQSIKQGMMQQLLTGKIRLV